MLPQPQSILVTGASGFIGSAVTRRLIEEGHRVRCLLRHGSRTDRIDGLSVERAVGDLLDPESIHRAARGCTAIIHLAGISAWTQITSPLVWPVIVDGTATVLAAAQAASVSRVVYVSSAASFGPADQPITRDETAVPDDRLAAGMTYVSAKRKAEELCLAAAANGRHVVIVNPTEVYGAGDHDLVTAGNILTVLNSSPVVVCRGGTSLVHVDDVAEGIVQSLAHGRSAERYLLGGDNLSHRELARLLLDLVGRKSPVLSLPAPLLRIGAAAANFLKLPFPIPPALVPYVVRYWYFSSQKARKELKIEFRPARSVLSETVAWLREEGHLN